MVFVMHHQLRVINTTFCPHRDGILCYIYKDRQILSWDGDASLIRPISIPGRLTWTQKSSPAVPKWTLKCLTTFDDLKEYAVGLFYVQTLNSLLLCEQPPPGEKVGSSAIRSHTLNHYHFEICPSDCTLEKSGAHGGDLKPALQTGIFLSRHEQLQVGGRRQDKKASLYQDGL